jgi:membrane protease YdiL (CAAX protease family)
MTLAVALTVLIPMSNNLLFLLPSRIRQGSAALGATFAGLAALAWLQLNGRLGAADFHTSALISTVVLGAGGIVLIAFRAFPALTRQLEDRRITQMSDRQFALHTAFKIPIATALAEEALFRGALWYAIQSVAGPVWALALTAVAFGMWHIVVSVHQGRELGKGATKWALVSVVTTTLAGLGFGWLRMITGGILAPMVAHCVINVVGSIGARIRARLDAHAPA